MTQPDHDQPLTFPARIAALAGAADSALSLDVDLLLRGQCASLPPPDWFGDLNAVVAEVERRGWRWSIPPDDDGHRSAWVASKETNVGFESDGKTACLALLSALVGAVEGER